MVDRVLTPQQLRHVSKVIRDNHLAFVAETFGRSSIDPEDYDRLVASGRIKDESGLPQDVALTVHALGAGMSGGVGHDVVELFRERVGQYVRAQGAQLDSAIGKIVAEANDQLRRSRVTSARGGARAQEVRAAAAIAARQIREAVVGARRDWLRVAHAELHSASEEAKAEAFARQTPGLDPRVFKRPRADACQFCVLLYLKPDRVTPRVFKLSDLLANGTNVGRRAQQPTRSGRSRTEWRAVVGAVHPFCQCDLQLLPDGMGFDARGNLIEVGVNKALEVEDFDRALADHACEDP